MVDLKKLTAEEREAVVDDYLRENWNKLPENDQQMLLLAGFKK